MSTITHRLTVGMKEIGNKFFLSFKAVGTLTHQDYELITPIIDAALEGVKDPKVKVLVDASEFEGWELQAAWDDFKLGLKYGNEFEKLLFTVKLTGWKSVPKSVLGFSRERLNILKTMMMP